MSPIQMRQLSAPEASAENAFAKICVADAALRDLYRQRIQGGGNPTRSTLLIRSFQKVGMHPDLKHYKVQFKSSHFQPKFPSHCPRIEVESTAGDCGGLSEDKSSDFPGQHAII